MGGASEANTGGRIVRRVMVTGRVQGVGYRQWTRGEALALGLQGFVRNRHDGTVEAVFAGRAQDVAAMIALCRRGPTAAAVQSVTESELVDVPSAGFVIAATV